MIDRLLIVAGEASGDQHGAHLLERLKHLRPIIKAWSVGGERLKAAGSIQIFPQSDLSVIGLVEIAKKARLFWKAWDAILRTVESEAIKAAVLIDFPDFNLRLAKALKKRGVKVFYYVSPQVWAWRKGRIRTIRDTVDHMFVLFPFEKDLYERHGVPVTFVGHPLLDEPFPAQSGEEIRREIFGRPGSEDSTNPVIGLLPGSRESEVVRLYPRMLEAFDEIRKTRPGIRALVPQAPSFEDAFFLSLESRYPWTRDRETFQRVRGRFREAVKACDLVVLASGTATLETALIGVPMIIVYVMNPLTYLIARLLIRVPFIGMVNLLAGRKIMPELVQGAATPSAIAGLVAEILDSPGMRERMKEDLAKVRAAMGDPGTSELLARKLLSLLDAEEPGQTLPLSGSARSPQPECPGGAAS